MTTYKIVDLFAGIGGLRSGVVQGIKELGHESEVVFTSEIKKPAIKVLQANYPHEAISGDIKNVDEKQVPDHHILLAGFPCQAFSDAGSRLGFLDSTKGTLFFDVVRILKEKKPEYFILENVEGLIRHDMDVTARIAKTAKIGKTFETILKTLDELGYSVDWRLLNATNFGVPQARKRVFIVGSLNCPVNLDKLELTPSLPVGSILETGIKETHPKVKALSSLLLSNYKEADLYGKILRDKRGGPNNIHSWNIDYKGKTSSEERELLELLVSESKRRHWSVAKGMPYSETMALTKDDISTFFTPKTQSLDEILGKLVSQQYLISETGGYRIRSGKLSMPISRVLDPKKYCNTLVATDANRTGVLDSGQVRRLTSTELKRLFGFNDDFVIPADVTESQTFDLFGNSVVVPVAKAVLKALVD